MSDGNGRDLKRRGRAPAWRLIVLACSLVGLVMCVGVGAASAASPRAKVGSRAVRPQGARQVGAVSASRKLHVTVALRPRDPLGLRSFASAVSTPGSPSYRHYLSVGQFAQRFGATRASLAKVESTLRSEGLKVGTPAGNHLSIPVTGTVGRVEKAFSVSEKQVRLHGGRVAYANVQAPTLPASAAAHVQAVLGLDNVTLAKPQLTHGRTGAGTRAAASAGVSKHVAARSSAAKPQASGDPKPSCAGALALQARAGTPVNSTTSISGYTADQIDSAYGLSSLQAAGDTGAGQTIALYELGPFDPSDIATYQSCYGTNAQVSGVPVDGGGGTYGPGDSDAEAAMDAELLTSSAPGAHVLMYDAPNGGTGLYDEWNAIISQNAAKVVSSSWGACEAAEGSDYLQAENTLFEEAAAQGQTVLAASGDAGSSACSQSDPSDDSLSVQDPSSQPFVTGVGGTSLYTGSPSSATFYTPGATRAESVWNDGTTTTGEASATTGGRSAAWAMPSYQSSAAPGLGVINADSGGTCGQTYCREVPDISADGDPQTGYVINADQSQAGGGWTVEGGTSAAAPMWAAYIALVNAQSSCRGFSVGFANPLLYQTASSAYGDFNDVAAASPITGAANNDALGVQGGLFPVTAHYDMTTGLGSMAGASLAPALCAAAAPVYSVTVANPGNQQSTVGSAASLAIHGSDSGGAPLVYSASGLPAGLAINPTTGVISGTPTTAQTTTVTVSARDQYLNGGSTSFTWSVVPPKKGKLQVKLSASPKHPQAGRTLTYTIKVRNRGTATARSARLTDKISGKRTILSASRVTAKAKKSRTAKARASAVKCTRHKSVTCKLGNIGAGKTVTVRVKVKPSRKETLKNTATATATKLGRATAHLTSHVSAAKKKHKTKPSKFRVSVVPSTRRVKVGQKVTYRITVRTKGHVTAHDVKVCDHVPAGLAVVSADHAKFKHGQACWTVKTLKPGHAIHRTITFRALGTMRYSHAVGRARRAATRTVVNRVTVTARGGARGSSRSAAVTVTLRPGRGGGVTG